MRRAPDLQVEEISGDKFPDRHTAQEAALLSISENLQVIIRDLLERGELVIIDGKIIPNPNQGSQESQECSTR
jgi:hypothetical protein